MKYVITACTLREKDADNERDTHCELGIQTIPNTRVRRREMRFNGTGGNSESSHLFEL